MYLTQRRYLIHAVFITVTPRASWRRVKSQVL